MRRIKNYEGYYISYSSDGYRDGTETTALVLEGIICKRFLVLKGDYFDKWVKITDKWGFNAALHYFKDRQHLAYSTSEHNKPTEKFMRILRKRMYN